MSSTLPGKTWVIGAKDHRPRESGSEVRAGSSGPAQRGKHEGPERSCCRRPLFGARRAVSIGGSAQAFGHGGIAQHEAQLALEAPVDEAARLAHEAQLHRREDLRCLGQRHARRSRHPEQIGREMGITRERVRQIERQALNRLAQEREISAFSPAA